MPKAAAMYLRLSREDLDMRHNADKEESNSISAQRRLIESYLDGTPELCGLPRLSFCDDGFSGTNFERPEFQRMIRLAREGEIGCIVVKDLSRFGRDYLEVGDYLEHIFPFLGIRFISVNDRFDSARCDGRTAGMDITFRNLVYDYYSRDLSVKVKSAMRIRQERGGYVSRAPYGYKPSAENKHRMVPDSPAAEIVREVFDAVLAGKSTSEIAAELNARGVPTPQQYKGVRRTEKTLPQWTHPRITGLIRNIQYTGVQTNHTRESRHIRDRNQRRVPEAEWILHPDAHEAIIPREKWEQANRMLRSPRKSAKTVRNQPDRVYYCAHCGRKLSKTYGSDEYYTCPSAKYGNEAGCASIRLRRSEMEELLLAALRAQLGILRQSAPPCREEPRSASAACWREIGQLDRELAGLRERKLSQYEAYRGGTLSKEDFLHIKEQLTQQNDALVEQKSRLEEKYRSLLKAQRQAAENQSAGTQAGDYFEAADDRLREHLYEMIERVTVIENDKIEVAWKLDDIFKKAGATRGYSG